MHKIYKFIYGIFIKYKNIEKNIRNASHKSEISTNVISQ